MGLKITASTLTSKKALEVHGGGITYSESILFSNSRSFTFGEIDYVLMSEDNNLSIQIKEEVFSIPVKPHKDKHMRVIDALVREVNRAHFG
jgi:hypothetical protein